MTQSTLHLFTKRILTGFITLLIVSSCSTLNNTENNNEVTAIKDSILYSKDTHSAQEYLTEAETATPETAILLMLKAAKTFNQEANYTQSIWLINKLDEFPLSDKQKFENELTKTESFLGLNKNKQAEESLSLATEFITSEYVSPTPRYYTLTSALAKTQNSNARAGYASLLAFDAIITPTENDIMQLWEELSALSHWELQQLKHHNHPLFPGWLNLILKANQWGDNKAVFDVKIVEFQTEFNHHPANFIAEQLLLVSQVEPPVLNNIAILLPLSGKHKSLGEIVQQGMLAQYKNQDTNLQFIDTFELDFTSLSVQFSEAGIDHVVGPLLKSNVDKYIVLNDIEIPTLLLNIPTFGYLEENQFAFSMRREDEANQAAAVLSNKNYKQPVLFSTQDRASRKVASTFANKWEELTGKPLETVVLAANEQMQKSLKTSLDIDVSKARIRHVEAQIRQKIKTENRNRRDIDMIYIAAPSKYTRLIKPFIDVNTSSYSTSIPMFASSLSHRGVTNNAEYRDLRGLTFLEIPWLLSSQYQNSELYSTTEQLWPNRPESVQRIFALGFDSLSIVPKLQLMKDLPYLRHFGQTGELNVNNHNVITRSIIWGKYTNGTVEAASME